jgi:hypothetical protein
MEMRYLGASEGQGVVAEREREREREREMRYLGGRGSRCGEQPPPLLK